MQNDPDHTATPRRCAADRRLAGVELMLSRTVAQLSGAAAATAAAGRAASALLALALLGGMLGAYAGRALFRHKTRKQPFGANLLAIAVLQVLALGALIGWLLSGGPAP